MSPKAKPPATEGVKGRLNRAYAYGQEHVFSVALVSLGLGAALAAFGLYSFFHERDIEKRVAKVESVCTRYPASEKCQLTKQRSDEKRSVPSSCVLFYKVDKGGQLLRLTKCPVEPARQKRIEVDERQEASASLHGPTASAATPTTDGGDALQPSTATQQPGRHEGGSGATDQPSHPHAPSVPDQSPPSKVPTEHDSGSEGVPSSPPSSSPAPSSPSSSGPGSTTTERITEVVHGAPPGPPAETASAPVREAVGGLVEEVGGTVTGTVEGVTGTTCELAKVLCQK